MVALGLVRRVLAEQEGVVAGKVGVVLHADASALHSGLEKKSEQLWKRCSTFFFAQSVHIKLASP